MTTQYNHPNSDDTCNTGLHCAECCELIPNNPDTSQTREIGDVVYHFCGPGCYQRWLERSGKNPGPE